MSDDSETVVLDEAKPAETETAAAGETKPKEDESAEGKAQQAGTPDKALQKMQQELGNVTRQLAALTEKSAQQGTLSEADKARVAAAQAKVERIRKFAARGETGDGLDDVTPIAEQVIDLTEKVSKQDQLEAQLRSATERLALLENDRAWQVARTKYTGLDVDAIWEKALGDAKEILSDEATPKAVSRLASRYFEERCDAAKKRIGDTTAANKKGTATAAGASAPGLYKVGSGQVAAPVLSDSEELLALARQLVTED